MPAHPLERLITSKGLRRACLYHDTAATLHRCTWNRGDAELAVLPAEQIVMILILLNSRPGDPAWTWAETLVGNLPHG